MKIMVTGSSGQLGYDVVKELSSIGDEVLAPTHKELDITNEKSVKLYFINNCPEALIHCAAYTDVDSAEDNEIECRKVNVDGTKILVDQCQKIDIPIIYISTDYVFDGTGDKPWTIYDHTSPINAYGLSKRDGENIVKSYYKHFIVRISWVFGINGKNFINTMLNLASKTNSIRVVNDQFGSPTYTHDLAPWLCKLIKTNDYGTYHAHNQGICTWYDVAVEIFKIIGKNIDVIPISTSEYSSRAKRPLNSRLDLNSYKQFNFEEMPPWKDAVSDYISSTYENSSGVTTQVNIT